MNDGVYSGRRRGHELSGFHLCLLITSAPVCAGIPLQPRQYDFLRESDLGTKLFVMADYN